LTTQARLINDQQNVIFAQLKGSNKIKNHSRLDSQKVIFLFLYQWFGKPKLNCGHMQTASNKITFHNTVITTGMNVKPGTDSCMEYSDSTHSLSNPPNTYNHTDLLHKFSMCLYSSPVNEVLCVCVCVYIYIYAQLHYPAGRTHFLSQHLNFQRMPTYLSECARGWQFGLTAVPLTAHHTPTGNKHNIYPSMGHLSLWKTLCEHKT
jgi:hypothetical protein